MFTMSEMVQPALRELTGIRPDSISPDVAAKIAFLKECFQIKPQVD
jgi:hypothetical protein